MIAPYIELAGQDGYVSETFHSSRCMKDEQRKQAQRAYQAYRRDANLLFKRHRSFKAQETAGSAGMVAQHLPLHQRGDNSVGVDLNIDVASSLDETEASVIKLMLDAVGLSKSETIVRIAGGWVRDKLLGLQVISNELCFAISPHHGSLLRSEAFKSNRRSPTRCQSRHHLVGL